jgi:hypothetical protein
VRVYDREGRLVSMVGRPKPEPDWVAQADVDLLLYGSAFVHFTRTENGSIRVRVISPQDVSISHSEGPTEP